MLLPDALDARDRCVHRLTEMLEGGEGLERVHVVEASETAPARLCMHLDPERTSVARVRDLAQAAGANLTDQLGHALWPATGITNVILVGIVPLTLVIGFVAAGVLKERRPEVYAGIGGMHPEDGHLPPVEPTDESLEAATSARAGR